MFLNKVKSITEHFIHMLYFLKIRMTSILLYTLCDTGNGGIGTTAFCSQCSLSKSNLVTMDCCFAHHAFTICDNGSIATYSTIRFWVHNFREMGSSLKKKPPDKTATVRAQDNTRT
jgi:hypothetical protein